MHHRYVQHLTFAYFFFKRSSNAFTISVKSSECPSGLLKRNARKVTERKRLMEYARRHCLYVPRDAVQHSRLRPTSYSGPWPNPVYFSNEPPLRLISPTPLASIIVRRTFSIVAIDNSLKREEEKRVRGDVDLRFVDIPSDQSGESTLWDR